MEEEKSIVDSFVYDKSISIPQTEEGKEQLSNAVWKY